MRAFYLSAIITFVIDQASKLWVMFGLGMREGDRLDVIDPLLVFKFGWNPGVNFGLFGDSPEVVRFVFIGLALTISGWLIWWAHRSLSRPVTRIAAGALVGGALANALDRVMYGAVADFLNMSCCGINNPYIFNIADIWIFAGAAGLILFDEGKTDKKTT